MCIITIFALLAGCGGEGKGGGGFDTAQPADTGSDCVPTKTTEDCATAADDDCSGTDNDVGATGCTTFYYDEDGDNFGREGDTGRCLCYGEAPWQAYRTGDCDDTDDKVHPEAYEYCSTVGVDDDCDGEPDDAGAIDTVPFYRDLDGDGYGASIGSVEACTPPSGYVDNADDCDDNDAQVHPGASELCDGIETDCDDATTDVNRATVYTDDTLASVVGTWTTLQTALDATPDGGVIVACPGTYTGPVFIDGSLTLRSLDGAETTIIDAMAAGAAVTVISGDVAIEGLTLTGGKNESFGGGIDAFGHTGSLELRDAVLEGNEASFGGGGAFQSSDGYRLTGTTVRDNVATEGGGGLFLDSEGELDGLTIETNDAEYGGGVAAGETTSSATDLEITGNTADRGAGIYVYGGSALTVVTSAITSNVATTGGGGAVVASDADNTLISDDCDWGEGATDNDPDDIYLSWDSQYDWGAGASFTCESAALLCY